MRNSGNNNTGISYNIKLKKKQGFLVKCGITELLILYFAVSIFIQ